MELAAWVLLAAFAIVGIAATIVYRDYRQLYAQVHHEDAPFLLYMVQPDRDAEVEAARVRTRNLGLLVLGVAIAFVIVVMAGRPPAA